MHNESFSLWPLATTVALSVTRSGIYWTLGKFLKPLATINLPKSPLFLLGNFCKGVKIFHFLATFIDIWHFFLVTLVALESY